MSQVLEYSSEPRARSPLVELTMLAAPTIAQMASYTLMQFIDTLFLAKIGSVEATAVGNAGMFAFSVISLGMGVLFVVNTLVSQSYGAKDFAACGQYLWQAVWFSVGYAILVLPLVPFAPQLFGLLGHETRLAQLEGSYLGIVVSASLFKMIGTSFGQFMLATNRPATVMVASICGVAVNAVAAWAMVLGHFGVPKMGVVGAAWAQNIGLLAEMVVVIAAATHYTARQQFNVLDWRVRWEKLRTLLKIGVPAGVQVVCEVLAWSFFLSGVIGTFGTKAMAATTYMMRYLISAFMPCYGLSSAVTALVGRYIGMKRPDLAARRAHLGFMVSAVYVAVCGFGFVFFRRQLMGLFTNDPEIVRMGSMLLIVAALYETFDAMYIIYVGGLRGAGDTLVPAAVTALLCWGIMLSGGVLMAKYFPGLGVVGPWIAGMLYGISLGIFMLVRFTRGGWKAIHLDDSNATAKVIGAGPEIAVEQLATGN